MQGTGEITLTKWALVLVCGAAIAPIEWSIPGLSFQMTARRCGTQMPGPVSTRRGRQVRFLHTLRNRMHGALLVDHTKARLAAILCV